MRVDEDDSCGGGWGVYVRLSGVLERPSDAPWVWEVWIISRASTQPTLLTITFCRSWSVTIFSVPPTDRATFGAMFPTGYGCTVEPKTTLPPVQSF